MSLLLLKRRARFKVRRIKIISRMIKKAKTFSNPKLTIKMKINVRVMKKSSKTKTMKRSKMI